MNLLVPRLSSKNLHTHYQSIEELGMCIEECDSERLLGNIGLCGAPNFILIHQNLPNYAKLSVAYHELGHHSCMAKKCKCLANFVDREFHAHRFCITELLKHADLAIHSVFYSMKIACIWAYEYLTKRGNNGYGQSSFLLFKSAAWRNALKTFQRDLYEWILRRGMGKYVLPEALG